MIGLGQVGVKTLKREDQNTSILPQTLWPEVPYEVDFCKKSVSTKIVIFVEN